jgi:hypothetical protein
MDASSWLDAQDQTKVTRVIQQLPEKNWVVGSTECAHYADGAGDERYLLWLYLTDRRCRKVVGLSIFDLSDANYGDFYQDGMSPSEAARAALENDDTYSALFGG